jgi:hypothetical protein
VRLQLLHLGRRQQLADDNRRARQPAGAVDELGVRALPCSGGAAEENDLLREAKVLPADFFLEQLPRRREDDAGVLDFEIDDLRCAALAGG